MTAISDYLESAILDASLRNSALNTGANPLVALFNGSPLDDGTGGAEISGTGYARQGLSGVMSAPAGGTSSNSVDITFPTAGAGGWGAVTHVAIYDTGGTNLLYHGALDQSRTVNNGDTFVIPATVLVVQIS